MTFNVSFAKETGIWKTVRLEKGHGGVFSFSKSLATIEDWHTEPVPLWRYTFAISLSLTPFVKRSASDRLLMIKKSRAGSSAGRITLIWSRESSGDYWSMPKQSEMTSDDCLLNQVITTKAFRVNLNCHQFVCRHRESYYGDCEQHLLAGFRGEFVSWHLQSLLGATNLHLTGVTTSASNSLITF